MNELVERIPDHAKDLRLNLSGVLASEHLSEEELWGTALASALAARNPEVTRVVSQEARERLSETAFRAAHSAAAVMAMNNVYYRFTHLVSNREYERMPARLRMQALANHGADPLAFELWCLAVSAINGCGRCVDSHEKAISKRGGTPAKVQDAVRIAAVLAGVAAVVEA